MAGNSALVKIPDIMKILKNSGYNMFEQIQKLPSNTKKVLCIATDLSQVSEAWKVISVKTLQDYCAESHSHFDGWSTQQFKSIAIPGEAIIKSIWFMSLGSRSPK